MTKLSLEIDEKKISWEVPEEDLNTLELTKGFYQILLGHDFYRDNILAGFAKFINMESCDLSYEDLLDKGKYYCCGV